MSGSLARHLPDRPAQRADARPAAVPEHEMIEELHVEESRSGEHLGGEAQIFVRGFWIAARMVVHQRKSDSTAIEHGAKQLADAHAGSRCRTNIDPLQRQEPIAPVDDCHVQLLVRSEIGRAHV